jgi:hypothetical protein
VDGEQSAWLRDADVRSERGIWTVGQVCAENRDLCIGSSNLCAKWINVYGKIRSEMI